MVFALDCVMLLLLENTQPSVFFALCQMRKLEGKRADIFFEKPTRFPIEKHDPVVQQVYGRYRLRS